MACRSPRVGVLKKLLLVAILVCFLTALFLGTSSIPNTYRDSFRGHRSSFKNDNYGNGSAGSHHLAVIVPFRDRLEELLVFAPFIHRYLTLKRISHDIVVVNQVDSHRFNRASLINAGFLYATSSEQMTKPCDYIAMHDVDLLPLNNDLPYNFPQPNSVTHVAGPGLHPKYNYPSFIGGILIVSSTVFRIVDGMSNLYWGWGLEDDEFYVRLKQNRIQVIRPTGISTGTSNTFRHSHSSRQRPRDYTKCFDQFNKTRRRDRMTGLSNVNYTLQSVTHLTIDEAPVVILNVQLHCNTNLSPWCDCPNTKNEPKSNKTITLGHSNSNPAKANNGKKRNNKPNVFNNYRVQQKEANKIS